MGDSATKAKNFIWREDRYRDIFRTSEKNELLVKIWRDAFGEDYPEEADPFGFVTIPDLKRFSEELKLERGNTLLDIGCGRGGPGLWVARKTGAVLIGIDVVPEAISQANRLKATQEGGETATFAVGSFTDTCLPSASVQAIMSVDSFWMVLDKTSALEEMARVIQPSGRFVMTTWVSPYLSVESMLNAAGFDLLTYEETPGWKERQMAVYSSILKNRNELAKAIGDSATEVLIAEAEQTPAQLSSSPRCFIAAQRKAQA